jgi:hypothetical protein
LHSPIRHLRCADRAVLLTATEAKPADWYKEPGTPGSFKGRRARASTRGYSAAKAPPIPRGAGAGRGAIPRTSSSSIPKTARPRASSELRPREAALASWTSLIRFVRTSPGSARR